MAITLNDTTGFESSVDPLIQPDVPVPDLVERAPFENFINASFNDAVMMNRKKQSQWQSDATRQLDSYLLDWDTASKGKDFSLNYDIDPIRAQKRGLVASYLTIQNGGKPVGGGELGPGIYRDRIANQRFGGRGVGSDEAFYAEIQKEAAERKSTQEFKDELVKESTQSALITAIESPNKAQTFDQWREKAKAGGKYVSAKEFSYREEWESTNEQMLQNLDRYGDQLGEVWKAMKTGGAGTPSEVGKALLLDAFTRPIGSDLPSATGEEAQKKDAAAMASEVYRTLDPNDRAAFMDSLGQLADSLPKEERATFFGNLAKQSGRDIDSLLQNIGSIPGKGDDLRGLGDFVEGAGPTGAQLKVDLNSPEILAARNFASDVRRIERGKYNPLKSAWGEGDPGWFEAGLYGAPGAVASTILAGVPYIGQAAVYSSMQASAYDAVRDNLRAAGKSDEYASATAQEWSGLIAAPQAALERLQAKALLGKYPILEKTLNGLTDKIQNAAVRAGARTFTGAVAETSVEMMQDYMPAIAQDIGNAMQQEVPDVQWTGKGGVFDGFWTQFGTTMVSMLPLAIGTGAGGVTSEGRARAIAEATPTQRLAFGFTSEANADIEEAAKQGQSSLNSAIDRALATRDPNSETAKAASIALDAETQEQAEAARLAADSGAFPTIIQTPDGWTVQDKTTGATYGPVASVPEAVDLAQANFAAAKRANEEQISYLASVLDAVNVAKDDKTTTEIDLGTVMTPLMASQLTPESAQRVKEQLSLIEKSQSLSEDFVGQVFGMSQTDFEQGQRRTVNKLYAGASVGTVFHEQWHGNVREAMATGRVSRDEILDFTLAMDALFKQSKNKRGLHLNLYPEGVTRDQITDVMWDEALSQIAEAEVLRSRKGGKDRDGEGRANVQKIKSGFVTKNIRALAGRGMKAAKKFSALFEAVRQYFGIAMGRAIVLRQAQRNGKLDPKQYDEFIAKITGLSDQDIVTNQTNKVGKEIVGDSALSIGPAITKQEDAAYLAAVESGDMETAQQMVNESAKVAGYNVGPVYHGSRNPNIEVFDRANGHEVGVGSLGFFTTSESRAKGWVSGDGKVYKVFLRSESPITGSTELNEVLHTWARDPSYIEGVDSISTTPHEVLAEDGSVAETDVMEWVVGSASQIKSADPITRDAEGNVIPLSERFNPQDDRISYSVGPEIIDPLISNAVNRVSDPKQKAKIMGGIVTRLQKLRQFVDQRGTAFNFDAFGKEFEGEFSDEKESTLNALATFDAILAALPPEIRGRVGGYTQLARLETADKQLAYLKNRMNKVEKVVDDYLKKEYSKILDKLVEKSKAKREGGEKAKGKLGAEGHRFFDDVEAVLSMTEEEVEAKSKQIDEEISNTDLDDIEALADLGEQFQIVNMFGNFEDKSLADMASAIDLANKVYDTNRNSWKTQEEYRLALAKETANTAIKEIGGSKTSNVQKAKARSLKVLKAVQGGRWAIQSFGEVLEGVFGENSPIARRWSRGVRDAMRKKTTAILAAQKRWKTAIESATGKTGRAARRAVWDMATKQTVSAVIAPSSTETIKVPIDTFFDAENQKALGLTDEEIAQLTEQFEALPANSRKKYLTLERQKPGESEKTDFTEAEAIYLTMLWSQDGYKDAMRKHGMGEEFQADLEAGMSDAAKDIRTHLATEYADNYEPLRALYAKMFGVDLRQTQNYTPGKFYSTGDENVMDVTGSGFVDGGLKQGFLKDRKKHSAEARAENAFSVYFNHLNQTEHWKAMAEISREIHGVLGRPEVKKALAGKDPEIAPVLNEWMKAIDGNGLNNPKMSWLLQAITTSQAYLAMSWKLSTILKNAIGATINAAYRMPTKDYAVGMSRLMSGKIEFAKIWNSDLIQNRLAGGFTPEVRAAISTAFGAEPTLRGDFLLKGMEVIGTADAIGTAIGAAITYDYHYRNAIRSGVSKQDAEAIAADEAAETISRTAQPVEISDRSLMELRLSGIGKIAFVFASEARQKSSMWLTAWANTLTGKATKKDLRVLLISHVVMAPIMHAIGAMIRDARDPEDDDLFDDKYWNPKDFAIAAATGPLAGIPLIRDIFDGFNGESGPLKRIFDSGGSLVDLFADEPKGDETDWYERKITKVLQGLGPSVAVSASVFDQIYDFIRNWTED